MAAEVGKIVDAYKESFGKGPKSMIGLDQFDWGGDAGKCFECWKCGKCCGDPCNPKDAVYCILCFWCCGPCTMCKYRAWAVDQDCAVINHCCLAYCGWCWICARHDIRKKAGAEGSIIGDCVCLWCCGPCANLQALRSTPKDSWDWLAAVKDKKVKPFIPECKLMA
eukprot:NODE_6344_length_643_cov_445.480620_g6321_i0.p1 GENE.NODE_6344_length_643_cov_445.480620_g6321_i0~~NODE_6344_length_643_cov_445.480620_g6321_i0.p1  ORF type:complete len:166 (+),score=20.13 NODE_6344_length_643_cov_445.480620_g6321_i0:71-568(+)